MAVVVAVDAGTTGVRALAVDEACRPVARSYLELPQHFPRPGWVEHDPLQIWRAVRETLGTVLAALAAPVAAIGLANQRETVVAWDRRTGRPLHRAVVWQDRRTAQRCNELRAAGHEEMVREVTGLVIDPYFSATKMEWLLRHSGAGDSPGLVLGTVDSWVLWNLTGGQRGGVVATDPSNAARTMLFDISRRRWSEELCSLFGVPSSVLGEVLPSSGVFGRTSGDFDGRVPAGLPVCGIAGDQSAALFGQCCFYEADTKATFGTGTFLLTNAGAAPPPAHRGLLTSVAWDLSGSAASPSAPVAYALEGSILASGAAVQWLRDGLGAIPDAASIEALAASVASSEGVVLVPAFSGLGSPWWDPQARGLLTGITPGTGKAHIARAVLDAIAHQARDVLEAIRDATGKTPPAVRADGGACSNDLLLQLVADQTAVAVERPRNIETTALGAAQLAGIAAGVWGSLEDLAACRDVERVFTPATSRSGADAAHATWLRALDRSRAWARA